MDVISYDRQKDVKKLTAKFSSSCLLVSKLDMSPQQIEQQPCIKVDAGLVGGITKRSLQ